MRLTEKTVLAAPPDQVFTLLQQVERAAACLPGATLSSAPGTDRYGMRLAVTIGPVHADYQGALRLVSADLESRRLVLDAQGIDQHGSGRAAAWVEVAVQPHAHGCVLEVNADLVIRGRVAQLGRGAIREMARGGMDQVAHRLTRLLDEAAGGPPEPVDRAASEIADESGRGAGPRLLRTVQRSRAALPTLLALVAGITAVAWRLRRRGLRDAPR